MRKFFDVMFSILGGLVGLIPVIFKGVLVVAMVIVIYLSIPLNIVSIWLKFIGELKFTKWWSRAWWECKFAHKEVANIFKDMA